MSTAEREGRTLNAEQLRAVERREGAMLLAAGAGSGKTSVLVERFVADVLETRGLGEDGAIPVDGILAITFTRLAAAELTGRIRERFEECGEPELAAAVEAAWIMTFDAFCARLLRSEAALAGLDPGFVVIDEAQEIDLREKAWTAGLASVLGDEELREGMVSALVSIDEEQLRKAVTGFHRSRRSAGEVVPELPDTPEPDLAGARDAMRLAAQDFADLLEEADETATVLDARERAGRCVEELDGPPETLSASSPSEWKPSRRGKVFSTPECDAYFSALDRLTQALAEEELAPQVAAIRALTGNYGREYEALKEEGGGLDFADLAIRATELIEQNPTVAEEQRRRFRRILVDEFQDTNALQIRLLEALGVEDLFMVGDELQSIYGFRDADVEIFRSRLEMHHRAGESERLSLNYRSTEEVLAFVNAGLGPIHARFEPLLPGSECGPLRVPVPDDGGEVACELILVDPSWNDEEELPDGLMDRFPAGSKASEAVEALAVAERIAQLVESGEYAPGDVAVLVRAVASIEPFVRALARAGVPAVAGSLRGWWEQPEVADLVAYLRLLANPEDEQALFETLASPIVGVGSDTLVLLATDRADQGGSAAEAMARAASGAGVADKLAPGDADRLARFSELYAAESEEAPWSAPSVLLERVIEASGFDADVAAGPHGPEALLRMRRLVRLAHDFEERESTDLRRFVDFLARHREEDTRMSEAPPGEALEAATVMTMHAAKGLQFPVVAVAALGRNPGGGGSTLLSDGERVGLKLKDATGEGRELFAFAELAEAAREREKEEECRLLHVAVTRAERRLLLSGTVALRKKSDTWTDEQTVGRPPLVWAGAAILDGTGLETVDGFAELAEEVVQVADGEWGAPLRVTAIHPDPAVAGRLAELGGQAGPGGGGSEGLRVIEIEAPTEGPPTATVSYSSLSAYGRCGYRWYLERVLGLSDRPRSGGKRGEQARARGQAAHALLERASLGPGAPLPTPEEAQLVARACGYEAGPSEAEELIDFVGAVSESPIAERLASSRRELSFSVLLGEGEDAPVLTGVIDALDIRPGSPAMVVDYKTDRLRKGADLEAGAEERYGVQRAAYALAVLESGQCDEVEVVHLFLERPQEPVVARFTAAEVPQLRQLLLDAARGLFAGEFVPSDQPWSGLCGDCPGRGGLCPVSAELAGRDRPS